MARELNLDVPRMPTHRIGLLEGEKKFYADYLTCTLQLRNGCFSFSAFEWRPESQIDIVEVS